VHPALVLPAKMVATVLDSDLSYATHPDIDSRTEPHSVRFCAFQVDLQLRFGTLKEIQPAAAVNGKSQWHARAA